MELFPPNVVLQEDIHKYYDKDGEQYLSFSSLYNFLADSFDAKKIAYFAGGKSEEGMIAKLDEWDAKREMGVKFDNALTEYAKTGTLTNKEFENDVKKILEGYGKHTFEQLTVYSSNYKVAGTIDKGQLTSNRKDSKFILSDFKCYENFDIHEYRKWLKPPFEHLPNSKFTKTAFQLSVYAFMLEELTGKKCGGLFIHLIDPTTIGGIIRDQRVYVPYLKNDVLILLETYKEQIKAGLTNKNEFVI